MLQCSTCTTYLVPTEEAREDGGAKQILFHVYEYEVLLHKDGKEHCCPGLVQKRATAGKFHHLLYVPVLRRSRYHMMSYRLAVQCHAGRRTIMRGSVSLHCNYGKRLWLSFNKEI